MNYKKIIIIMLVMFGCVMTSCGNISESKVNESASSDNTEETKKIDENQQTEEVEDTDVEEVMEDNNITEKTECIIEQKGTRENPYHTEDIVNVHFATTDTGVEGNLEITFTSCKNGTLCCNYKLLNIDDNQACELCTQVLAPFVVSEDLQQIGNSPIFATENYLVEMSNWLSLFSGGNGNGWIDYSVYADNNPRYIVIYYVDYERYSTDLDLSLIDQIWFEIPNE